MITIPTRDITRVILLVSPSRLDGDNWPDCEKTITFKSLSQIVSHRIAEESYHCWLIYTKQAEKTARFLRDYFSKHFQVLGLLPIVSLDNDLEIFERILQIASQPLNAGRSIYCDCTGGTKTMSIAMALACVHHRFISESQTQLILTYIPPGSDDFHDNDLSHLVAEEQDRYIEQQKRMGRMEYLARFSPILAHEIRNPLALINANLYLLHHKPGNEYSKELLGEIERSVNEIDRIINNVQQVVRGEVDYLAPPIKLAEVVQRLKARTERRFPQLDFQVSGELSGIHIRIAEEKLYTIFTNLIDNAANATQGAGAITLDFGCHKDRLLIAVKDNGPGIPEELQSTLFQPMRRGKTSSGTGMGLSIVKTFVSEEGGAITYDADYKKGARFLIELPIYKNREAQS